MHLAESLSIAAGLAMALSVFAFKTAVGEYYFFSIYRSTVKRTVFLAATWGAYLLLFVLAFALLSRFDLFGFAGNSSSFLQTGTALHLLLCGGLLVWGIRLLCHRPGETPDKADSNGWLLLAVPCPVCASAVFLVCAFARMLLPEYAAWLPVAVPAFFLLFNILFLVGLLGIGRLFSFQPLWFTGKMMIFIALYFILILLVAPQLQDVGKLYATACAAESTARLTWQIAAVCLLAAVVAAAGFLLETFKRKGR
jgi:predicted transporter